MKNLCLLLTGLILLLNISTTKATTHIITVADFAFSPSVLSVEIGDTVKWMWMAGSHTTTSTGNIPVGAQSWDAPINSATSTFSYAVKMAGSYSYICSFHQALGMTGTFTATVTGVSPVFVAPSLNLSNTLLSEQVEVSYNLEKAATVHVELVDLLGKIAQSFSSQYHTPGEYTETYPLAAVPKGMYVLQLRTEDMILTKKIEVQ